MEALAGKFHKDRVGHLMSKEHLEMSGGPEWAGEQLLGPLLFQEGHWTMRALFPGRFCTLDSYCFQSAAGP